MKEIKYKTIDLCAGIGGIRRGFELTGGFENVLSAEIDPFAIETYKLLFHEDPKNDLTSEEFKQVVDQTEYDVLLAGFPCQAFSGVGKKLGFRDATRGTIFFSIADIISRTHPRAVFLENVEGLLYHDGGQTMKTIIDTLESELHYRVIGVTLDEDGKPKYNRDSFIRNTKFFGLPQNRPRAYIMAFSKDIYGKAIKLLNEQLPKESDKKIYEDLRGVLESEVDDRYYMAQGYLDTLKRHRVRQNAKGYGFGYVIVNQEGIEKPIANTILATGGSGRERNLIYQPKEGVAGKWIVGKKTPLNNESIRVMTPTEWGRLQGFIGYAFLDENGEEGFRFPEDLTDGQKFKQFGNSVSVPVIEKMAEFMLKCFDTLEHYQEIIVKAEAPKHNYLSIRSVMEMLNISQPKAKALLDKMAGQHDLLRVTKRGKTRYMCWPKDLVNADYPPFDQRDAVLDMASEKKSFTNQEVAVLLNVKITGANVLLSNMVKEGQIKRIGRGIYATVGQE